VALMADMDKSISPLKRERLKKSFYKVWKTGQLQQVLTPQDRYRLCCARLYLRDYSNYAGWEWRDEAGWSSDLYYKEYETPKWGGGYVNRLVVMGEQGIGDQMMFASILPECRIRVKEVIYECDPRLHELLQRSLGVTCRTIRESGISTDGDAYIPAAELMRMFRRRPGDFPRRAYLKPDPERVLGFARFQGRTGVSWRGRQGFIDPRRIGIGGVNLQYDALDEAFEEPGIDLRNDVEGVVALCAVLDKVVCVPTSVMHFAGAVGAKVEVIEPEVPGEVINQVRWDSPPGDSAWYPKAHVYRSIEEWKAAKPIS
jgi:hypothetical protein